MKKTTIPQPALKWAGGKRQLLKVIRDKIPNDMKRYYEPFLGGGAVLFDYLPKQASISDYNCELINMYIVIKNTPELLIKELKKHELNHSNDYFYFIRNYDRDELNYSKLTNVERAARTIYLNRTCYNGLFRVSKQGYFNTPIGRYKNPKIVSEENLRAINNYLNGNDITILCSDYTDALKEAEKGDFAYLDPPYFPISRTSSFTGYTEIGFDENEQIKLNQLCDELNKKGVRFLLSNSNCKFIKELYTNYNIEEVSVRRSINSKGYSRIDASEVLITNY